LENEEQHETRFIQVSRLQSIKTKIIVFALLATIIPSVGLGTLSYIQNRTLLRQKIANELRSATIQSAGELDLWLKERFYDLKVFSSSYVVSENLQRMLGKDRDNIERLVATNRVKEYLRSVREKFTDYRELVLVNMIGDPLVTSSPHEPVVNLPAQWFEQLEAGRAIIGAPYWDQTIKTRVVTLAEVIKSSENHRLGILAAKIDLASIVTILKQRASEGVDEIYLTDGKGRLVTSSAPISGRSLRSVHAATLLKTGADPSSIPAAYMSFRNRPVVGVGKSIPAAGWAVFAEMEESGAYAAIVRLGRITLILVGILLLLMGVLAYFLARTIVRPLKRLSGEAARVASGDLNVDVPVGGSSEISYLTQVFNHMVSSLRSGQAEISQAHQALIEKNRELHLLSITDGLTGLFNRKHLMDLFDMEMARTRRYKIPFSVLIADIDHFKRINDTYGHLAGDSVLRRIAGTLRGAVRECDHIGRYGGEEFLLILPNSEAAGAMDMAQRIREQIRQVRFYNDGNEISMTISVGVAQCSDAEESVEAVLGRADSALYQAKNNGRDQVIGP
jgi:diguanylate cyclase (GGDEF)-like protein